MQQFAFSLQLVDDETLSNRLLEALAPVQPENVPEPEPVNVKREEDEETEPIQEPTEPTEPKEPKTPEEPKETMQPNHVKEEGDEWDGKEWWEWEDEKDWYWEGVEEEVQQEEAPAEADEIEWVRWPPTALKPIEPKKMPPTNLPPPPPPPPPAESGHRHGVKAPWAWDSHDRAVRVDKYGGTLYKSGWYKTRQGDWWPILWYCFSQLLNN